MPFSMSELWKLNKRAQENFSYRGKEKRYLEAFLIQSCLLEGALRELMMRLIKKNLKSSAGVVRRKEKKYKFDIIIDDLYLMHAINAKEFKALHKYRDERNDYMHRLIHKGPQDLGRSLQSSYKRGTVLIASVFKKLEKEYGKNN